MKILLTGGAGYIGSHVAHLLTENKKEVVVFDNLSAGFDWAVPKGVPLVQGDVTDPSALDSVFSKYKIDSVIHFAALTQVGESVQEPLKYYFNNTVGTVRLLAAMKKAGVKNLIFSSTAAVYGSQHAKPVREFDETKPESPYGQSKLNAERAITDLAKSWPDFRYGILRYFNVAGAHPDGVVGQATKNATHVIKVACEVAAGKRNHFEIYGEDYPTPDGTCIRDYVHVWDLATAHEMLLTAISSGADSNLYNVGYNRGYSVKEVLATVEKVSQKKLTIRSAARRPGDVISVIADTTKIQKELNFKPRFDSLEVICKTAFQFESKLK